MKKNILALIMAFAMIFTMAIPAFASAATYKVTFASMQNGTVTADKTTVAEGETVTLTVTPAKGYQLKNILGATESYAGVTITANKFTMPAENVTISASFEKVGYDITLPSSVSNGTISVAKDTGLHYGDEITLTVTPDSGYAIDELKYTYNEGDGSTTKNISNKKFTMPASDVEITVSFKEAEYSIDLDYTTSQGAVVSKVEGSAASTAKAGDDVEVTVIPSANYRVKSVIARKTGEIGVLSANVTIDDEDAVATFVMPAGNVTVEVVFERIPGTEREIEVDDDIDHGDVDVDVTTAEAGETVTVTVDPDSRYLLEDLSIKAGNTDIDFESGYNGEFFFTMPDADVYITADFYKPTDGTYDITVDSDDGDVVIAVTGTKSGITMYYKNTDRYYDVATKGDDVMVYVSPDAGYVVEDYDAEGASAIFPYDEDTDSFRFKMPSTDVEVVITYEEDEDYSGSGDYDIDTIYKTSRGDVDVQSSADKGDKVYIYIDPKSGYSVDEVLVYEDTTAQKAVTVKKSSSTKYYFTMPGKDVVVEVLFTKSTSVDDDDDDGDYEIFIIDNKHGDISTNKDSASKGDTVRINIDPDSGYEVDEVIVTRYDDDRVVSVSKKSTYWTFTMPADDVIIEVTFTDEEEDEDEGAYEIDLICDSGYADIDLPSRSDSSKTVKIYIDLYDDCEVDEITVTRTNGKTVTVKKSSSYYYFTMPASDVEVEITFDGDPIEEDDDDTAATGDYKINLSYDSIFGDVTTDSKAEAGEKVYVKFDLEHEVKVKEVKVISASTGEELTAKKSSDTKYYFTMPEDDVYVVCLFNSEEYDGETTYHVDLNIYDEVMGDASLSLSKAAKTQRVYLFIDEDSEYAIGDVIVSRDNGRVITTTKVCDYVYYFAMPAGDVDCSVYFDEEQELRDYKVALTYDKKMGEVLLSDETADAEDDVYIYVEEYKGYELVSVKVKRTSNGKTVSVKTTKAGDYYFEMPEANVTVTVTFAKIEEVKPADPKPTTPETPKPTEPVVHICPAKPYTDVDTTLWYHDAIDYVVSYNLMTGYSATLFAPNDNVSRAMIVTVLWRIAGQPATTTALPYTDVAEGQWYTEAVRWAAANGLLVNVAAGTTFEPNSTITREQFASVIYKYQKLIGGGYKNGWTHPLNFSDLNLMSAWALEPLTWCNEFGILNGVGYDRIDPQGTVTRAQLAQILLNLSKLDA